MSGVRRNVLFLQGMASRFFAQLGAALAARGHTVHRVNFHAGDRLFWGLPNGVDFRGRPEDWPEFLHALIRRRDITDIILFGDCRPLHAAAISLAGALNVAVHVCEEGYIRPDWVVFELGGVNGHSSLPRDPAWYRTQAASLAPLPARPPVRSSLRRRGAEDLLYNAAAIAGGLAYPHYRTHRPRHRMLEYASWTRKLLDNGNRRQRSMADLGRIAAGRYYLLPLQLETDSQIRQHSPFAGLRPMIARTIASFVRHAPADTQLVVKEHPLDDGAVNWRQIVTEIAANEGASARVVHLETGDTHSLVAGARGLVTVNSTTGTLALSSGVPVITLGLAIYDIAGLTFQGELDQFWGGAAPPDAALYDAFRRTLADRCLLPGSFFSDEGIKLLVSHAVLRLEATPLPVRVLIDPARAANPALADGLLAASS